MMASGRCPSANIELGGAVPLPTFAVGNHVLEPWHLANPLSHHVQGVFGVLF